MARLALVLVLVGSTVSLAQNSKTAAPKPVTTIEDGVLDAIQLFVDKWPGSPATPVVMRKFSGLDADLGTGGEAGKDTRQSEAKTIKAEGPRILAEHFAAKMKELGALTATIAEPGTAVSGALVVDGKFTKIDPGSRTKRYFVGFGAGKSTVSVSGTVTNEAGLVIATFAQTRYGAMGFGGGDSLGKLLADSKDIGADIAQFLSDWAKGKSLK